MPFFSLIPIEFPAEGILIHVVDGDHSCTVGEFSNTDPSSLLMISSRDRANCTLVTSLHRRLPCRNQHQSNPEYISRDSIYPFPFSSDYP